MQAGSDKYKSMDASGKYVRYTNEQVEALERVYHECPKPSSIRRHQLIKESPILANIEPKQIKVWFQNRRYILLTSTFFPENSFYTLIALQHLYLPEFMSWIDQR